MKTVLSFLFVVACVHANSIARYGWAPNTESVYRFESQILSSIPEIRNTQYAGMKLQAKVTVQATKDYKLRIKIQSPRLITLNGEVSLTEAGRIIKNGGNQANPKMNYPQDFRSFLEKAFVVDLKRGLVTGFYVLPNEPEAITNIKRSILSQLQLDVSGSQLINQNSGSLMQSPHNVMEQSVGGKCQTMYNVVRMTPANVIELERKWENEEIHAQLPLSTGGKMVCSGKPYYEITKTKNLDNCVQRPVYQHVTGADLNGDASYSHIGNLMAHKATTVAYVCGELSSFNIRKVATYDTIVKNPVGYNTEQALKVASRVMMELLEMKTISSNYMLPNPATSRCVKSLVYDYQRPPNQQLSNEVVERTKAIIGVAPILPQPTLTGPPVSLMPIELPKQEIMSQIVSVMSRISKQVTENPESIRSSQNITSKLRTVSKNLELLSLDEINQVWNKVTTSMPIPIPRQSQKIVEGLMLDVISMAGTNPATMFVLEKVGIDTPRVNTIKLCEIMQSTIKSIKTPTTELIKEIINLINKLKTGRTDAEEQLLTSTILQLSNLLHHSYVNPSTMVNKFPVRIYGIFGTEDSAVLKGEYIPLLKEMLQLSGQNQNKHRYLAIVSALGKLGHIDAAEIVVKVARDASQKEPMIRVLAIHSLKHAAKKYPNIIRPLLLAIINNPVEHPDVRVASIDILPWVRPSFTDLQKIAVRSWYDTSNQVSSFARSTFESLINTQEPELQKVAIMARDILHMFKPTSYGFEYSKNVHLGTFVKYLLSSVTSKYSYTVTKEPEAISRISIQNELLSEALGKGLKINIQTFSLYMQGLEQVTDYALLLSGYLAEARPDIKSEIDRIVNQIHLETPTSTPFMAFTEFSSMGHEYAGLITPEVLMNLLLNGKPEPVGQFSGTYVTVANPLSIEMIMPLEAGFQISERMQNPMFFMINASANWDISDISQPKIGLSGFPIFNGKTEANYLIASPYSGSGYPATGEFIGTGISMALHVASPVQIDVSLRKGHVDIKLKFPEEVLDMPAQIEVFDGYVLPFTARSDLKSVEPIDDAHDFKSIRSGDPLKKVDQRFDSYISGQFHYESDNKFVDLYSYWEKIKENSLDSLLNVYPFMSSVRYSRSKLSVNPSQSNFKHANINFDLWARQPSAVLSKISKPVDSTIVQEAISKSSNALSNIITALNGAPATIIRMQASIKGSSVEKTIEGFSVIGNEASSLASSEVKTHLGAVVTMDHGMVYGVLFNGNLRVPSLNARWSLDQILQQQLTANFDAKLVFGELNIRLPNVRTIVLKSIWEKTHQQIASVMRSADYKACKAEIRSGKQLSPVCIKARHEAASLDQVQFKLNLSPDVYHYPTLAIFDEFFKAYMFPYLSQIESHQNYPQGIVDIKMNFAQQGDVAQVKIQHQKDSYELQNVRIPSFVQGVMPISVRNHVGDWIEQKATNYYDPASCRIEPEHVSTFDNKTYAYKINGCEHVVMMDGSRTIPVAVLAREVTGKGKAIKVLAPKIKLEMDHTGYSINFMINGKSINPSMISQNQIYVEKDPSTQEILAKIKHFQDGVYHVYIPKFLDVITDGKSIEVVASQLLRGRSAGLCGDMNGEEVADVSSPGKCIMSPKSAAISYMIRDKRANAVKPLCEQSIPAQDLLVYQREVQNCPKDKVVPTMIVPMFEKLRVKQTPVQKLNFGGRLGCKQRFQSCQKQSDCCSGHCKSVPDAMCSGHFCI